jgi:hypothetical protein
MKDDPAGLCFWHNPETAEARRQAGRRGGRRGKVELQEFAIDTIDDVKRVLVESLNELRQAGSESITAKSRAVGYLCSILIMAIERGDLELRVSKLENQLLTDHEAII